MRRLVVDASFATAVVIKGQRTSAVDAVLANWNENEPIAPYVFALELPWVLLRQERRAREQGFAVRALASIETLRIQVEDAPDSAQRAAALRIAIGLNMGFYDAMYLLTAQRSGGALLSRDGGQVTAASRFGVPILDVR